ncbi:reverse transcriptase domain-containing protein [Streptomyces sp. NBC_01483]|uniref:reverse transcriptase domain-containing protein n=1 Tax=Streptomyces sp. NBC_01483 TaxID=2903883 RepID=UPI002E2FC2FA|nr:reverse transcriptase domain-containing protein [Streptomyces sp. NBC_01483]
MRTEEKWKAAPARNSEWEARFGPKTYGFRAGRGCHDAIVAIRETAKGKNAKRLWVLDADLKAAFDYIDHDHLLSALGAFPGKGLVAGWLKAGVIEKGWFTPPRIEGTIQQAVTAAGARRTRDWGRPPSRTSSQPPPST